MHEAFPPAGRSRRLRRAVAAAAVAVTATTLVGCSTSSNGGDSGDFAPVTLRFAHYLGPTTPQAESVDKWAEEVNELTDGKVSIEFSYSGSLLEATDILPGVGDGRADLGWTGAIYHPSELGLSNLAEIPFLERDPQVQMDAYSDLYNENGILAQEYTQQGVHVLLWPFLGEVVVGSNDPIESVDDLRGVSVRAAGGVAQSLQTAGANPVALTAGEIYEALQRGTIGAFSSLAFEQVGAFSLPEVAKNVTITGIGEYTQAVVIINDELWNSFPDDIKQAFETANEHYQDYAVPDFLAVGEDATCQAVKDAGGQVIIWDDAQVQSFKDLIGSGPHDTWVQNNSGKWPQDQVEALYDEYVDLLAKYSAETTTQPGAERCVSGS